MTPHDLVVDALQEHSFDHEAGECICGYRPSHPASLNLAGHVADQILSALDLKDS